MTRFGMQRRLPWLVVLSLLLGACTAGATPAPSIVNIEFLGNSTQLPYFVAQNENLYQGINVNVTKVGFGEQNSLFASGNYPVTGMAPWEVATAVSQGDKVKFFNTAGAVFFFNGVVIRAADKGTYQEIADLKGKKLGIPGFGTGTWQAFRALLKKLYNLDAQTTFNVVEADTGVLLALLEKNELDAALTFTQQAMLVEANPSKFATLFSFDEYWRKETGQPLLITGLTARNEWLDANQAAAKALAQGADAAVDWMSQNSDKLLDAPYRQWLEDAGITADPGQLQAFIDRVKAKNYFATSTLYTQDWIKNQYEFIESSVGVLVENVPPSADIFNPPS